jgi:hypothetical protein
VIDDCTRIGYDASLGTGIRLMYGAFACDWASVGGEVRIGGFVCDAGESGPYGDGWSASHPRSSTSASHLETADGSALHFEAGPRVPRKFLPHPR